MSVGIILIHQKKWEGSSWSLLGPEWATWSTCLRQIALAHENDLSPTWEQDLNLNANLHLEIYRNEEAYGFLLEVISGLHSPLVGETEVLGQFKQFIRQTYEKKNKSWTLYSQLMELVRESKCLRRNFLTGLGGQSYGSMCRKYLGEMTQVSVLGAGRLSQDILPWLIKKNNESSVRDDRSIKVFTRSPSKVQNLDWMKKYPEIKTYSIDHPSHHSTEALIVAAPVSEEWLAEWSCRRFPYLKLILDLRGNSATPSHQSFDRPGFYSKKSSTSVISLQDFFASMEENRQQAEAALSRARHEVGLIVQKLRNSVRHRPFGWDDLCA